MGKDLDPQCHLPHSAWQVGNLNYTSGLRLPDMSQQNTNSMVFPTYSDTFRRASSGNHLPFPGFYANKSLQNTSGFVASSVPTYGTPGIDVTQKRFLVFDQSANQINPIYSSFVIHQPVQGPSNPVVDLQGSNETNVTDGQGGEEMHEDTEEINALLYSDSEEDFEEGEASTGHTPVKRAAETTEEVASSSQPAKKRRHDSELDASILDTASSARAHFSGDYECTYVDNDAQSSCVGGGGDEHRLLEEEEMPNNTDNKWLRRERIQETIGVLRKIIPGGEDKDAVSIIDEAICYLKSLRMKAMTPGALSL
ncbi:transcription factor bHLH145-like [Typha latifolia]|uniref:transcription factor bHLH145-like n=1 Tax=Typha latifolia TaxID=4733 RepID=UPI003C30E3EF